MNNKTEKPSNAMWGGRFAAGLSEVMEKINASIDFDKRLYEEDIAGSKAHCAMLVQQAIISPEDGEAIAEGLEAIRQQIARGDFAFSAALEDIHMNVENRLRETIGEAAGRLHTARSRNDQVALDFRLWVRRAIGELDRQLVILLGALIDQADENFDTIMPGYTHLQAAQPVTFGHHLLAYVEMFGRDLKRLRDCRQRMNECPLGAAALAGTSFPIDRHATATALGFDRPTANSMDSVSDRDFALEFLSFGSILAMHLSRLSEEFVIWCSEGFRFLDLSDAFTTGSSIMPQKKNPDAAELVRGKSGRVIGAFNSLIVMMKGLPMTYGKDMQEDKEPVFDAADTLILCVTVMAAMVKDMKANREKMLAATASGFLTATDLADWLVRVLGMAFRDAHHCTGALVKMAEDKGIGIADLSLEEMRSVEPQITERIFDVLSVEASVLSRRSYGGTAPDNVKAAAQAARDRFLSQ